MSSSLNWVFPEVSKKIYIVGVVAVAAVIAAVVAARVRNNVDPLDPGSRTDSLSQDRFYPKE